MSLPTEPVWLRLYREHTDARQQADALAGERLPGWRRYAGPYILNTKPKR